MLTYFGFDDNRLGYGGASLLTAAGGRVNPNLLGSDGISPTPRSGNPGVGGYFSPQYFVSNTGRVDVASRLTPALRYRFSGSFGVQSYTNHSARELYGFSGTLDYTLTDRLSIPLTAFEDNAGPFTQERSW